ncbi:MAG: hypothetical protein PHX10_08705 [Gallionellaceae bacterium]|nr:hypothetical protein [Gallionellaceae bacterium]
MRRLPSLIALFLAAPLWAESRASPGTEPPAAVIAAVADGLRAGASDPRLARRLLRPLRPGSDAWLADFEKAGTADWCGSGGCRMMLFKARDGGYRAVFDRQVRRLEISPDGVQLTVQLYGAYCGKPGNASCPARYRWHADRMAWQPEKNAPGPFEYE